MKKSELSINDVLLMQNVKRWTVVQTIRDQSVAEHTFNVTMIARAIAKEAGISDENIIKYALDHDLDEIMTGDIPSPAKDRFNMTDPYNGKSRERCSSEEVAVVMLADLIETASFIADNQVSRHGNIISDYVTGKFNERMQLFDGTMPRIVTAAKKIVDKIMTEGYACERS